MKKPRKRRPGTGHSASYTDEQWAQIKAWAKAAGMSASAWWGQCVTTVDLSAPEKSAAPPLVLDEEQQRRIARVARELAEGARNDVSSRLGAMARELLRERLHEMVREGRRDEALDGLRTVFGEERAEVFAAVLMPDEPKEAQTPGRQKEHGTGDKPDRRPRQGKLL